jgi:hypothetical protein
MALFEESVRADIREPARQENEGQEAMKRE